MAPKKANPVEDPPAASSTEEEEEEEEGEEEEGSSSGEEVSSSSEDEEETQPQQQMPSMQTKDKPHTALPPGNNGNESESETETESEYESEPEQPAVKPLASRPIEGTPKRSKSKAPTIILTSPSKSTAAKRGGDPDQDAKISKRVKTVDSDGIGQRSEDTNKQLFQRIFSEDDEVALLGGLIEFSSMNGIDPAKDMSGFHDFIKKSVHFDVSLSQLKDKIGRLRKKFLNNSKKHKATFSNPHDQKVFDLSKKIWGSESAGNAAESSSIKAVGKAKNARDSGKLSALKLSLGINDRKEDDEEKVVRMEMDRKRNLHSTNAASSSMIASGTVEEFVLKEGLCMLHGAKRAEMEEKWRNLRIAELKLYLHRNELINKQVRLMLDAYRR